MKHGYLMVTNLHKLALSLLLLCGLTGCDRASLEQQWISALAGRISADYQALYGASLSLADSVGQFCSADAVNPSLQQPQMQWKKTMAAWQHIQWVRFGPVMDSNDDWKIQFWPDKKNILDRKIQQLLNRETPLDAQSIGDASVVVQGLSALELLLFDDGYIGAYAGAQGSAPSAEKQCEVLQAIAGYFVQTTKRINNKWQDQTYREQWVASVNAEQEGVHATAETDVVAALLTQMEKVKLDKIGGPLGYKNRSKQPNGYFSESWRSNTSLDNIKTNLLALQTMLDNQDGMDLRRLLIEKGNQSTADELGAKINESLHILATLDKPLRLAVTDVAYRPQLEELHESIGGLNSLIKVKVTAALGIALGFNSNDGD